MENLYFRTYAVNGINETGAKGNVEGISGGEDMEKRLILEKGIRGRGSNERKGRKGKNRTEER